MFGRRRSARNHRQRLLDELVESYGHLKLAAGHVAGGAAEKVTPSYDRARDVAVRSWSTTRSSFPQLSEQLRLGAAQARREKKDPNRKWPILFGLLAAGVAVGALGAMVARRRAAAQWDEYQPLPDVEEASFATEKGTSSTSKKVTAGAAAVADSVSSGVGKIAETLHEKTARHGASARPVDSTDTFAPFADESDSAKNAHP